MAKDIEHVKELVTLAVEAGLSGAEKLVVIPIEEIAERYNGIGPACLSEEKRRKLTKILKFHEAPCVIHDVVRFDNSDGTTRGFNFANDELEANCLILADHKCGWYNPMRYWHRHGAYVIAGACRLLGWKAWIDAYQARLGKR